MKGLDTIIKLRKRSLDERRRKLASIESQKRQLQLQSSKLREELEHEIKLAGKQAHLSNFFGSFAERIKTRQEQIAKEIIALDKQIVKMADEIAIAFGELKKFEIARENARKRAAAEQKRKDTIALDEIAGQQHQRKLRKESDSV